MKIAVHQAQYMPWLGYFHKIHQADLFVFLDNVQYKKREFQNRNKILLQETAKWLTVPVESKGRYHQLLKDVTIDYTKQWVEQHLSAICHAYGKAPYFLNYFPAIENILKKEYTYLEELNRILVLYFMQELKITTPCLLESEIGTRYTATERLIELCQKTKADGYLSGSGGRDYMQLHRFEEEGLELEFQSFTHPVYQQGRQNAKESFIPYLSILDLLFNLGDASSDLLLKG